MPNATNLSPGIYFNLPAEIYHSDRAISRSDCVNLLDTPRTYWDESWMNPERKRKKTGDALEYGEAFHYMLFEPREFERLYQVVGVDEWDDRKRKKIAYDDYFSIAESIKVLREGADSNMFLSGGKSEVTIVFDCNITGLRFRARHDYLTPILTTDFKTARGLDEWLLKTAFKQYGLDIQFALYKRSRQRFKEQFRLGEAHVYGNVDKKFFDKFMEEEINEFIFIFQRKTPPYPYEPLMPEDDTEDEGQRKIYEAGQRFHRYMRECGKKKRWPACDGKTKAFSMFYGIRKESSNG